MGLLLGNKRKHVKRGGVWVDTKPIHLIELDPTTELFVNHISNELRQVMLSLYIQIHDIERKLGTAVKAMLKEYQDITKKLQTRERECEPEVVCVVSDSEVDSDIESADSVMSETEGEGDSVVSETEGDSETEEVGR